MRLFLPSGLWRCWLGCRKGICKKTEWWGAGMVICLEQGADLHMAQLMPLTLTVSCFSKIQIGFTFLVRADPGSPGKRAAKWVCVRQEMVGFRDSSGISWTICKQSAPRSRQITTPSPYRSIFTDQMLFLMPNPQCQSTEGSTNTYIYTNTW